MNMNRKHNLLLCIILFLLAGCNMGRELYNEPAPLITFDVPDGQYTVKTGQTLAIMPQISYDTGASYTWELDGITVGTDKYFTFSAQEPGTYFLTFKVTRPDITVSKQVRINVIRKAHPHIFLAVPVDGYSVLTGTSLTIRPIVENNENTEYLWKVNQVEVSRDSIYTFTSSYEGNYDVFFSAVNEDGADEILFRVNVADTLPGSGDTGTTDDPPLPSDKYYRPSNQESHAHWSAVLEYTPAPGQFINELETGGFSGENTREGSIRYAEKRLKEGLFVSLGAFGGYLVAGFDHSIVNDGGYNLQITGNAYENSSEPGIVWVMQDSNGNGLPDDTWYELKGSEHSNSSTRRNYAVTYFRPREPESPVHWIDNEGNTGTIDYLGSFHSQDSYYPLWIDRDYYTLTGTCLESCNYLSQSGSWISPPYGWGYADNNDQDLFRIADAVTPKGDPVEMGFIDFVKVQTGVQGKSAWLGEISTEICSISDYNLIK